ncbi:MAG: exodeoxyribonuclease III [Phycisphaerales bacterium]|nr:exodeoxyribonuclease III [Phycisphaerales bacterium]
MRIATWNVNGLRAAIRKGLPDWLEAIAPDVLLLQEIRCLPEQLPDAWATPSGWHVAWHPAERKGYAGTAIFSRAPIGNISRGMDDDDPEGRVLRATIEGVDVVSVYLPSGSSSEEAQVRKTTWMARFGDWMGSLRRKRRPILVGGDLNIARDERDIFHWRSNRNTSGFLPHERAWMNNLVDSGWRDLIREHFGDVDGPYSWWSQRGQARALDRGWRIDYLLANATAARRSSTPSIHRDAGLACSDHAPVIVDLT